MANYYAITKQRNGVRNIQRDLSNDQLEIYETVEAAMTCCPDNCEVLEVTVREPSASVDEYRAAMREASALALGLWRKHYQDDAPNFRLSDTAAGVITQIDNMVCSLVEPPTGAKELDREKLIRALSVRAGYTSALAALLNQIERGEFDK